MKVIDILLTINQYSRTGAKIQNIKGVVVHYYANPNTTALQNRNFFEKRKNGADGFGSAHYLIGLEGEIIRAIPENEIAYHVGASQYIPGICAKTSYYPNNSLLGIECAHINESGKMTEKTFQSLYELVKDITERYKLTKDQIYLHYDITGKVCHKWFVDNPAEWTAFKNLFS